MMEVEEGLASMKENGKEDAQARQQQEQALQNWLRLVLTVLKGEFEEYEVGGKIAGHPLFGPLFIFRLKQGETVYECGFLINELVTNFKQKSNPGQWLASFFVEMLGDPAGRPLPEAPKSEQQAKKLFEEVVIPACEANVREEFPDQNVHMRVIMHKEHGPMLEAGFPVIKEGNNTCAVPLQYLLTLHLLNRDPSEPVTGALHRIWEAHVNPVH